MRVGSCSASAAAGAALTADMAGAAASSTTAVQTRHAHAMRVGGMLGTFWCQDYEGKFRVSGCAGSRHDTIAGQVARQSPPRTCLRHDYPVPAALVACATSLWSSRPSM